MNTPPKTHNSDPKGQVKIIADRILRMREEADAIRQDIKEIYVEAKNAGFDVAGLRRAVRLAAMDPQKRADLEYSEEQCDLYLAAMEPG